MERMVERCGGLDVGTAIVVAAVRVPGPGGGRDQETRTFATTTVGLLGLADWLGSYGVTRVGMESTSVYWKPIFYVLEGRFECWLLNAQHMRNVPGRKTDVGDSAWICQLVEHGLVRPSFVPPAPIRELRDLTPIPQGPRSRGGSEPSTTACWSGTSWPTSTTWTRPSPR